MDDIDSLLDRDGARWRDELALVSTRAITPDDRPHVRGRHIAQSPRPLGRWAPALAVVCVLAVAGIVLALRTESSHSPNPSSLPAAALPTSPASVDDLKTPIMPGLLSSLPSPSPANTVPGGDDSILLSLPWRFVKSVPDMASIDVMYVVGDGSCVKAAGFRVIETSQTVELLALSQIDNSQQSCPAKVVIGYVEVKLSAPLGDRRLLHGPVDSRWANTFPG